jgi:flagellar biosynthesis protein FlhB
MDQNKVASLLGLTQSALLIRKDADAWIKLRQIANNKKVGKLENIELARSIFKAWDN